MAPKYIWDPGKLEEQRQFIMVEAGLTDPVEVPWIEEDGSWHNRLIGIDDRRLVVSITLEDGHFAFHIPSVDQPQVGYCGPVVSVTEAIKARKALLKTSATDNS